MIQLKLWPHRYPWSEPMSLLRKIVDEAKAGIENNYHFHAG